MDVEIRGPFCWLRSSPRGDPWLFTAPEARDVGVYLWAVPYLRASLVCWVGFTTRRFEMRFREHTMWYLAGTYTILDTQELLAGRRVELWHGMWTGRRSVERVDEFLLRAGDLAPKTRELLQTFRVYLLPIELNAPKKPQRRILARIEAAMVNCLYQAPPEIADIMDKGYHLEPRLPDEPPIHVDFKGGPELHGIPRSLDV